MAKYIPLDALVSEIKRLDTLYHTSKDLSGDLFIQGLFCFLDTLEVKEVDLENEIKEEYLSRRCYGGRDNMLVILNELEFNKIAKHFFELGMCAVNPLTAKDIKKIYHLVNEVSDDLGIRAMYVNIYQEVLKRFNAQKEGRV